VSLHPGLRSKLRASPVIFTAYAHIKGLPQSWVWSRRGRKGPVPPYVKWRELKRYRDSFNLVALIETGTYRGDTIAVLGRSFDRIYSIELNRDYFEAAARRFDHAHNVTVLHGDSGELVRELVGRVNVPTLFWLDAHYSGGDTARGDVDSPVTAELAAILEQRRQADVILIDDARLFVGTNGYPTIPDVVAMVQRLRPGWTVHVFDDIVRIHPRKP
jgi:hypothetical protein